MAINTYDRGDLVRATVTIATSTGNVDPSPLKFSVWAVSASTTAVSTFTYGVDAEVVKDAVGSYHSDVYADVEGPWRYEWTSTAGSYRGAQRGEWRIIDDVFST